MSQSLGLVSYLAAWPDLEDRPLFLSEFSVKSMVTASFQSVDFHMIFET